MISNKQFDASISSATEQRFFLFPILLRRQPIYLSLHLDMVGIEQHCNMLLQAQMLFFNKQFKSLAIFFEDRYYLPLFLFFYNVILKLRCMGSQKLISWDRNLFFIQFSAVSVQYFLAYSSLFVILVGISTSSAMFCVAPWKGST